MVLGGAEYENTFKIVLPQDRMPGDVSLCYLARQGATSRRDGQGRGEVTLSSDHELAGIGKVLKLLPGILVAYNRVI